MNALFDLMYDRERRTLGRLGLAAALALVVVLVLAVRVRGGLARERRESADFQASIERTVRARDAARTEWQRWQQAVKDLEDLRSGYLYSLEEGVQALRLDLQGIFALAGTTVADIGYNYADLEKERIRKTLVTFTYSGTYAGLKRLLAVLEAFPKFLIIEKVEFPRVDAADERLSAKLTLAGYYGL